MKSHWLILLCIVSISQSQSDFNNFDQSEKWNYPPILQSQAVSRDFIQNAVPTEDVPFEKSISFSDDNEAREIPSYQNVTSEGEFPGDSPAREFRLHSNVTGGESPDSEDQSVHDGEDLQDYSQVYGNKLLPGDVPQNTQSMIQQEEKESELMNSRLEFTKNPAPESGGEQHSEGVQEVQENEGAQLQQANEQQPTTDGVEANEKAQQADEQATNTAEASEQATGTEEASERAQTGVPTEEGSQAVQENGGEQQTTNDGVLANNEAKTMEAEQANDGVSPNTMTEGEEPMGKFVNDAEKIDGGGGVIGEPQERFLNNKTNTDDSMDKLLSENVSVEGEGQQRFFVNRNSSSNTNEGEQGMEGEGEQTQTMVQIKSNQKEVTENAMVRGKISTIKAKGQKVVQANKQTLPQAKQPSQQASAPSSNKKKPKQMKKTDQQDEIQTMDLTYQPMKKLKSPKKQKKHKSTTMKTQSENYFNFSPVPPFRIAPQANLPYYRPLQTPLAQPVFYQQSTASQPVSSKTQQDLTSFQQPTFTQAQWKDAFQQSFQQEPPKGIFQQPATNKTKQKSTKIKQLQKIATKTKKLSKSPSKSTESKLKPAPLNTTDATGRGFVPNILMKPLVKSVAKLNQSVAHFAKNISLSSDNYQTKSIEKPLTKSIEQPVTKFVSPLRKIPLLNKLVHKENNGTKKEKVSTKKSTQKQNKSKASKRKSNSCRNYRECLEKWFSRYSLRITPSVNTIEKLRDFFSIIFKMKYEQKLRKQIVQYMEELSDLRLINWATIYNQRPKVGDWLNIDFLRMPLGIEVPANLKESVMFHRIVLLKGKIDGITENLRNMKAVETSRNKIKDMEKKRSFFEKSLNGLRSNKTIFTTYRSEAPSVAVSGFDRESQVWSQCAPKENKGLFAGVYQNMMSMNSYQCALFAFMKCIRDKQASSFKRNEKGFASLIQLHYDYGAKQNKLIPITSQNKFDHERFNVRLL
ncbi:ras guanine nucleotide exchange factor R-like [Clytia hemisphaerica]|uniref:Cnidarian restricted protein n=1 Tax=Clytia hemisphaerica TaxID=252671 RepID=A0A7M5UQF7_9CNID